MSSRVVACGRPLRGAVRPPGSKSLSHRALLLGLLAGKPLRVEGLLVADDIELELAALPRLGVAVERPGETTAQLAPGPAPAASVDIDCGAAGTMIRLLTGVLTVWPGTWTLDGTPRLRERPVGPLVEALRGLGASIECLGEEGYPPLRIRGGALAGGRVAIDAEASSQYLSALLLAATRARGPVEIEVEGLSSAPYVRLTLDMMAAFGARVEETPRGYRVEPGLEAPKAIEVEADWSAAIYPAAGALLSGGCVHIEGARHGSSQGDRRALDLLARMGAEVEWESPDRVRVEGSAATITPIDDDLSSIPDQVPTLAAVAAFARGLSRLRGVAHLRLKESDRLRAMRLELERLGARVRELPDGLELAGCLDDTPPLGRPIHVETWDDHRIAMSLALVGLRRPGVVIEEPEVVAKSYPGFWHDLERLQGAEAGEAVGK